MNTELRIKRKDQARKIEKKEDHSSDLQQKIVFGKKRVKKNSFRRSKTNNCRETWKICMYNTNDKEIRCNVFVKKLLASVHNSYVSSSNVV